MGQEMPRKRLTAEAMAKLHDHSWPGNVRELMHVLERGAILAAEQDGDWRGGDTVSESHTLSRIEVGKWC